MTKRRTDESIKAHLLDLQQQDLKLIERASADNLTFEMIVEIGEAREAVGRLIEHEHRLWTRRGHTIDELFEEDKGE